MWLLWSHPSTPPLVTSQYSLESEKKYILKGAMNTSKGWMRHSWWTPINQHKKKDRLLLLFWARFLNEIQVLHSAWLTILQISVLLILLSISAIYYPNTFIMANTAIKKVHAKQTLKWPLTLINATEKNKLTLNQCIVINSTRTIPWIG